jgi:multiple sugar transport system substrate-binding protein
MLPEKKLYQASDNRQRLLPHWAIGVILFVLLISGAGCSSSDSQTPTLSLPTHTLTPTSLVVENVATPTPQPVEPGTPITLTMWLPPEMAQSANTPGNTLYQLNEAFVQSNPDSRLVVVPKAAYGPGGIANLVSTTQPVMPGRLPDVIAFDTAELHRLMGGSLLIPLDDLIASSVWDDLFPFAVQAVTVGEQRMAVPFQVDITFLAYDSFAISDPPRLWEQLEPGHKYLFPVGEGASSADAFLIQYLARGGTLVRNNGQPYLDSIVAAEVLQQFQRAVQFGVVPSQGRNLSTLEECWNAYLRGDAHAVNVGSWLYQRDRAKSPQTLYASIPTADGTPATIARSWGWAILTQDPKKQQMAVDYILSTLHPETLSSWSAETRHLPPYRSTLSLAIGDPTYREFIEQQLEHAYPYPNLEYYDQIQEVIIRAIDDVLDGVVSPEQAAVDAATMVNRLR